MSDLLRHYKLDRHPFARSAPKDGLLRHKGFEEARRRLHFTVELDGIAALVADSGCGKSVLLGELADELREKGAVVHYFAHATVGPFGLVNVLARKVGLNPSRSRAETALAIAKKLLEDEHKHVLVVDESHELPDATLEDLRLLTIADFDRRSPFLLLLAGQPALEERLADPTHHALDQRITTLARLLPLSLDETRDYLKRRIAAAGAKDRPVLEDAAADAIFDASSGIPRRINNVATSALVVAASRNRRVVSAQDVQDARLDRGRG
jgi:type II secretory pathway predicted ATPase ExeA